MKPDERQCMRSALSVGSKMPPKISFTPSALKWIRAMVECHDTEVGFLGLINEVDSGYVVTEIFYPKHCLVSEATCEISPQGDIEIAQTLVDLGRIEDVNKVRMHGHSHVNMETNPSGQDETLAMEGLKTSGSYYIRAICNKRNEMSVSFFDAINNIKFENIKWTVAYDYNAIWEKVISSINMESNVVEKILAVRNAVTLSVDFNDDEYKRIVELVKELKKVNLPEEKKLNSQIPWEHDSYYDRNYGLFDNAGSAFPDELPRKKKKKNLPLLTNREIESVLNRGFSNAR